MDGDVLELTLSSASFDGGNKYDANITTTVKNTIGPLSNLKLSAELNATSNIHIKETSKPVVHAVYPKVNLTKMATGGNIISQTVTFCSVTMKSYKHLYDILSSLHVLFCSILYTFFMG